MNLIEIKYVYRLYSCFLLFLLTEFLFMLGFSFLFLTEFLFMLGFSNSVSIFFQKREWGGEVGL